jgi:ribonucleoside-diphosphate reductase alpha chain
VVEREAAHERRVVAEAPVAVASPTATEETAPASPIATTPVAVMQNGVSPIVRLKFSNGQELRCTPNHRVWTLNRGYIQASALTHEDQVFLNDSPTPAEDA